MKRTAFTMVELIFVIVIIGILASIAVPKLSGVTEGAKKSAEIATISAVSTAIETANGEWSINEGEFTWGNRQSTSTNPLNSQGYPNDLSNNGNPFGAVIKGENSKFIKQTPLNHADYNASVFTGPASNPTNGISFTDKVSSSDIPNKPDKNDFWVYISYINPSMLCAFSGKDLFPGDFLLIDINGTSQANYNITFTCN